MYHNSAPLRTATKKTTFKFVMPIQLVTYYVSTYYYYYINTLYIVLLLMVNHRPV